MDFFPPTLVAICCAFQNFSNLIHVFEIHVSPEEKGSDICIHVRER